MYGMKGRVDWYRDCHVSSASMGIGSMFLLGSRALHGIVNAGEGDDWDLLLSENEMLFSLGCQLHYIKGNRYRRDQIPAKIDAIVVTENKECIMSQLYRELSLLEIRPVNTEIGAVKILPYPVHKALLLSIPEPLRTLNQKHYLNCMHDIKEDHQIVRQLKSNYHHLYVKDYFFDGYKKRRYLPHDRIHWWVSQAAGLCQPTYLSIMISSVEVSEDLFHQLPLEKKYSLFFEEALVLSIERFLIKNSAETDRPLNQLWQEFFDLRNDNNPARNRLIELCTVGDIADHPEWLATWGGNYFSDLMPLFREFMSTCMKSLPQSLVDYMNYLRTSMMKVVP